jgi:hypothetical protein
VLTGVVCYIERTPGGNGLRRLRLVGPELDQSWVAPSVPGDDPARPLGPGEQLAHIRAAAAWIAEEISPTRELVAICLDPEGGVCSWISAPSADPQVVLASIRQLGASAAGPVPTESAPKPAGFGLLPDESLGVGSARSVQALTEPEPKSQTSLLSGSSRKQPLGPRRRLGVLSVADAPVRVLIDELDRLRIGVGAVLSFWHAAGLAWDPGAAARAHAKHAHPKDPARNGAADHLEPIVVEAVAPVVAAVIVDPSGRLVWSWSKAGDLLAAGSMRLRTHTFTRAVVEQHAPPDFPPNELELPAGAQRLLPDEGPETVSAAECSSGDVGRLIMDWLSWSVQLGQTPDHVICVGPTTIPHRPQPGEPPPTPESIARALAAAWPGAGIDAAIHDDPIGATLNRLRALPMFAPSKSASKDTELPDDPRLNLISLTSRVGRFDRSTHYWATLAILAAAVAVFLYSHRLGSGISSLRTRLGTVQTQRLQLLQSVEGLVPAASKSPDPMGMISSKIQEINEQLTRVSAGAPALTRILPALQIFSDPKFADVQITMINASDIEIRIDFSVPEDKDLLLPAVRDKLDEKYGPGVWTGSRGSIRAGRIPYSVSWPLPGGSSR